MYYIQKCPGCGETVTKVVSYEKIKKWRNGALIQEVYPNKDSFFREWLISGMCYECQSKMFNRPAPGMNWGKRIGECEVCGTSLWEKDKGICPCCKTDNNALVNE